MSIYYVYAYLRNDGSPYYIGKGKGNRAFKKHCKPASRPKDPRLNIFLDKNLTEEQAFQLEKDYISILGRKDNGTGILRNLTDGGEGTSGHKHSDISKKKISISNTGRILSEVTKEKIRNKRIGTTSSNETKNKISKTSLGSNNGMYGKTHTNTVKNILSKVHSGKKLSQTHLKSLKDKNKGENNPNYGKRHSEETRKKMREGQARYRLSLI